jgi:2-dehydropantoate 2-reductase
VGVTVPGDPSPVGPPILVWGAGAMGGTIGAQLARSGIDVLFVDRVPEHVEAINTSGLTITGPVASFKVEVTAALPDEVEGSFQTILLCVKAHHTREALGALKEHVAEAGAVVSIQNGLNEGAIADAVGWERTVGAFVNFGADYLEPGVIHWGGRGAVVVGEPDGSLSPRAHYLHALLRRFEPDATLTDNIFGYLWGKQAYAALLFATALTDASIADVLEAPAHRDVLVELAREVIRVARASGVRPEAFDGFDPGAFGAEADDDAASRSLDDLVAFNRRSAKSHSGIWRDLAVRQRRTEVDAQMGRVVEVGEEMGVPTPLTRRLVALIHELEEGQRQRGWDNLGDLASPPADES